MYRVCVLTSGKYDNVVTGNRYCLSRKSALDLANLFNELSCTLKIEKLIRTDDIFFWSEDIAATRITFDANENGDIIKYRIITRKERKEIYR